MDLKLDDPVDVLRDGEWVPGLFKFPLTDGTLLFRTAGSPPAFCIEPARLDEFVRPRSARPS